MRDPVAPNSWWHLVLPVMLMAAIEVGVKWYFTVIPTCVFLLIHDCWAPFYGLSASTYFLLWVVLQIFCVFLRLDCFCYLFFGFSSLDTYSLSDIHIVNIFPCLLLLSHFLSYVFWRACVYSFAEVQFIILLFLRGGGWVVLYLVF